MVFNIHMRFLKYTYKEQMGMILTVVIFFIIFAMFAYSLQSYILGKDKLARTAYDVSIYKNRSDILRYNKSLTEDKIDEYNIILASLIPDTENFFSIIFALERISEETGFIIVSYDLNLTKSNKERIAITIEGQGNADSFISFLKSYSFTGGRLITSEKIDFSDAGFSRSKISLNFYNKKVMQNSVVVPQLSAKDIELLDKIKVKISYVLKPEEATQEVPYTTKTDPF